MELFAYVMLGFAPGVFWLWLIYQRDRYIPAPVHLVVRTFLWGVAVSVPVVLAESLLLFVAGFDFEGDLTEEQLALPQVAYVSFVVAGMTEEMAKYLVLKKTVYGSLYFRQPLDGVIFSAAVALGFASIENVGYIASFGAAIILVRGPISTVAHVLFSTWFGYALGARKLGRIQPQAPILSLMAAMALHGVFDFLLMADQSYVPWAFVLFAAIGLLFILILRVSQRQSPYRHKVAATLVTCPRCAQHSGFGASFCPACGLSLALAKTGPQFLCGSCNSITESHHQFCSACGSRLDRKLIYTQAQT